MYFVDWTQISVQIHNPSLAPTLRLVDANYHYKANRHYTF